MKKYLTLLLIVISVITAAAQDTVLLQQKWRNFFADAGYKEDYYKLTREQFDKMYQKKAFYKILVVFRNPEEKSLEWEVQFNGLLDLTDRMSALQLKGQRGTGLSPLPKSGIETFVFDNKYIFRREQAGPMNDEASWGIVYLNGPIYAVKTFGMSKLYTGKEGYTAIKYEQSTMKIRKDEYQVAYKDPAEMESNIRFKARMGINFKEAPEIVQKVEADSVGYGKPDLFKMIQEYNESVKKSDPDRYEASIYPKIYYRKPKS